MLAAAAVTISYSYIKIIYLRCPPVRINSGGGLPGGTCRVSGQISSQFLSALLMAAPLAQGPVTIEIVDKLVSAPYVRMTVSQHRSVL